MQRLIQIVLLLAMALTQLPSTAEAHLFCRLCDRHHQRCRCESGSASMTTAQNGVISSALLEELLRRVVEGAIKSRTDDPSPAENGALAGRVQTLEGQVKTLDDRVTKGFAKIDETLNAISQRQEQTVHALEGRLDETLKAVGKNTELIQANAIETLRLVNLTALAPNHRVKEVGAAKKEELRVFSNKTEATTPSGEGKYLVAGDLVRVVTSPVDLAAKVPNMVVIRYVSRVDGELSKEHYMQASSLEKLY